MLIQQTSVTYVLVRYLEKVLASERVVEVSIYMYTDATFGKVSCSCWSEESITW